MSDKQLQTIESDQKDSGGVLDQIPADQNDGGARARLPSGFKASWLAWAAAAGIAAGGAVELAELVSTSDYFQIRRLEMIADVDKVPITRLKDALQPSWAGSYFTADIDRMREAAEELPWVKSAQVERVWPDAIRVKLTLFNAMAQYEDGRLVSDDGFLFAANPEEEQGAPARLPVIKCAQNQVGEATKNYKIFEKIFEKINADVMEVSISDRQSWSIVVESSYFPPLPIELGRDEDGGIVGKVEEIAGAFPSMIELMGAPPSSIDARYDGAFAAGVPNRKVLAKYLEEERKRSESASIPVPEEQEYEEEP